jgi:hypothetical protein
MSRPVRTGLGYPKPIPPPTANEILESMRNPDPELIAKYPHADFNAAVRKAEHTESMRRGGVPVGAHISAYQGFAGSVKYATEQLMAQQEKEYLDNPRRRMQMHIEAVRAARMAARGESAAAAIISKNEDNIFGINSLKSKRVLPKVRGVYTNLLGIQEKSPKELANQAEQQALLAEEHAAELQAATNRARRNLNKSQTEKQAARNAAIKRIRNTPRNIYAGHGQPSEHNRIAHWEKGMSSTWAMNQSPKIFTNAYTRSQKAQEHAKAARQRATLARRRANQNKNLLVFPSREEELAGLFNQGTSGGAGAGAGAGGGGGGGGSSEGGRSKKRKTRRGKKRTYRKRK